MTDDIKCSESNCQNKAVKEIEIRGTSPALDRNYLMKVYVCKGHYDLERSVKGNILGEWRVK